MGRHPRTGRRHNGSNRSHGLRRLTSFFSVLHRGRYTNKATYTSNAYLSMLRRVASVLSSAGRLCKLCDHALKSSDSSDDYVLQKLPLVNTFLTTGRPFGVTILALWNYSVALVALFSGLVFLAGPKALARIPPTLGFPGGDDPDFSAVGAVDVPGFAYWSSTRGTPPFQTASSPS